MKKLMIVFFAIFLITGIWACDGGSGGCGGSEEPTDTITVTGPITGGQGTPQSASILDLPARGYAEEEFFFEGWATSYRMLSDMTIDGRWEVEASDQEKFKTRILVRRPVAAATFNGTVVVEWLNVSAGADGAPGFMYNWQELLREGYAWVGVSAQEVGVQGGGFSMVEGALPLKEFDPERYGSLNHPGDAYSYDIFSIAARVVRGTAGEIDVLGGLTPQRLLAYGESQSAMTMISYVDGVHPLAKAYDGFFIHSRMAGGIPVDGSGGVCDMMSGGDPLLVRTDLDVPVFQFQTESDVEGSMGAGSYQARQPDTALIRTWEVAGTAHADKYLSDYYQFAEVEGNIPESTVQCEGVNDGPQQFVLKAALHHLNRWVAEGILPPTAEPLTLNQDGSPITDEHGNTLGGVRTPDVDVPIATLKGAAESGSGGCDDMMCALFGQTIPFSADKLLQLYPTHEDYVAKVAASAAQARQAGYILEPEEQAMVAEAQAAAIPF